MGSRDLAANACFQIFGCEECTAEGFQVHGGACCSPKPTEPVPDAGQPPNGSHSFKPLWPSCVAEWQASPDNVCKQRFSMCWTGKRPVSLPYVMHPSMANKFAFVLEWPVSCSMFHAPCHTRCAWHCNGFLLRGQRGVALCHGSVKQTNFHQACLNHANATANFLSESSPSAHLTLQL